MAALNLSFLLLPVIQGFYYLILLVLVLLLNFLVSRAVLKGVEPSTDSDEHGALAAFSKRWIFVLGFSSIAMVLFFSLAERLDRQVVPFFICGYAFFFVAYKVLEVSVGKRMDNLRDKA